MPPWAAPLTLRRLRPLVSSTAPLGGSVCPFGRLLGRRRRLLGRRQGGPLRPLRRSRRGFADPVVALGRSTRLGGSAGTLVRSGSAGFLGWLRRPLPAVAPKRAGPSRRTHTVKRASPLFRQWPRAGEPSGQASAFDSARTRARARRKRGSRPMPTQASEVPTLAPRSRLSESSKSNASPSVSLPPFGHGRLSFTAPPRSGTRAP